MALLCSTWSLIPQEASPGSLTWQVWLESQEWQWKLQSLFRPQLRACRASLLPYANWPNHIIRPAQMQGRNKRPLVGRKSSNTAGTSKIDILFYCQEDHKLKIIHEKSFSVSKKSLKNLYTLISMFKNLSKEFSAVQQVKDPELRT